MLEKNYFKCSIDIPVRRRGKFLTEILAPLMTGYDKQRLITSWFFIPGPKGNKKDYENIIVYAKVTGRLSVVNAKHTCGAALSIRCAKVGGKLRQEYPGNYPGRSYLESRYGGRRGVKIFTAFAVHNTRLVIQLLKILEKRPAVISRHTLGLILLFYFMDTLRIAPKKRKKWLGKFLKYYSHLKDGTGKLWKRINEISQKYSTDNDVTGTVRLLNKRKYRALHPNAPVILLNRYRKIFCKYGRALQANRNIFARVDPLELAIFHSYIHIHFLCLGISNLEEIYCETLAFSGMKNNS